MTDYMKPSLSRRPNHIIIHTETNVLSDNRSEEEISKSIINLAMSANTTVSISSIVCRGWSQKAKKVNTLLQKMCQERNMCFISNDNINKGAYMRSKVHLNKMGTNLLMRNFVNHGKKHWCFIHREGIFTENAHNDESTQKLSLHPLQLLKQRNSDKIIIGHLNINSIRNKFSSFCELFKKSIDVVSHHTNFTLMVSTHLFVEIGMHMEVVCYYISVKT